jgi:hypothetical protein
VSFGCGMKLADLNKDRLVFEYSVLAKAGVEVILKTLFCSFTGALLLVGSLAFAQDHQSSGASDTEALFTKAIENTDSETLNAMQVYATAIASMSLNSQLMHPAAMNTSKSTRESQFLSCVIGHLALIYNGRIGVCVDGKGATHILSGTGWGLSFGIAASIVIGIVRVPNGGGVRGTYGSLSVDRASTRAVTAIVKNADLIERVTKIKPGIGIDFITGTSREGNTIILVGPANGTIFDFSKLNFTIE